MDICSTDGILSVMNAFLSIHEDLASGGYTTDPFERDTAQSGRSRTGTMTLEEDNMLVMRRTCEACDSLAVQLAVRKQRSRLFDHLHSILTRRDQHTKSTSAYRRSSY